jgi:hypothetical protein
MVGFVQAFVIIRGWGALGSASSGHTSLVLSLSHMVLLEAFFVAKQLLWMQAAAHGSRSWVL